MHLKYYFRRENRHNSIVLSTEFPCHDLLKHDSNANKNYSHDLKIYCYYVSKHSNMKIMDKYKLTINIIQEYY